MVCQIEFTEWTRDDRLRQPVFLGVGDNKNADEVVREKASEGTSVPGIFRTGSLTPTRLIFHNGLQMRLTFLFFKHP
jgi:hypothetical protein